MCEAIMDSTNVIRLMRQAKAVKCCQQALNNGNYLDDGQVDVLMVGEFQLANGATTEMIKLRCSVDDFKAAAIMIFTETCPTQWPLIAPDFRFSLLLDNAKGDNFLHYQAY